MMRPPGFDGRSRIWGLADQGSDVVDLLQRLIRNACVNTGSPDSGHEHRSVAILQDFFGVPGEVFEPSPGRQSLVYRIAGTDPDAPSMALVPHLDVVPADPDHWTQDPFGADIVDGFVYGRGAVDMLNITAAFAHAVRPYLTGELRPRGDLVFAAVADEEGGGLLGAYPLVKRRWDLVGADYLLTEVAYPKVSKGSNDAIPVSIGEKGSYFSRLKTSGVPGHGSGPYRVDNALAKMVRALNQLLDTPPPVAITSEWVEFVEGAGLDPDLAEALCDPDRVDEAIATLAATDLGFARYSHSATHLTISANLARAGTKSNIIPDRASAVLDIRPLPGMDRDFVNAQVAAAVGSTQNQVDIKSLGRYDPTTSATGGALWDAITRSVEDTEGHRNLLPTLMTVASDARFWRRRGTTAYGVGLYDEATSFSDLLARFHGHDERVSVESVDRTAALYERVLHHFHPV